jgi:parallel beta-helix repeat protein
MAAFNITTGACPEVARNSIVGSVFVFKRGGGHVRDNDISSPAPKKAAALEVRDDGSAPRVTGNRIHHTHGVAVYYHMGGGGLFSANTISDTDAEAVEVADPGTEPVVRDNTISDGKSVGVRLHSGASPTVDGNEISSQGLAGLLVCSCYFRLISSAFRCLRLTHLRLNSAS